MWIADLTRKMWAYSKSNLLLFTFLVFCSSFIEGSAMSLLIPAIDLITVGTLSDNAINHNVEKLFSLIGLNPTLLAILTLLVLLIFFSSLFILTKELLLTKFSLQLLMRVRKDIYHHLVNAPWLYLINCQKSEFSYYLIEESAQIPNAYFQLCNLMAFIGTALVYASLCFYINIEMSAIIMVAMACSHLLFHRKIKRSTDHGKKHQLINRAYATTIVEHFDAINLIKSSVSEDVCERDIGNILDKMKAIRYEGKYHGILITVFSAPVILLSRTSPINRRRFLFSLCKLPILNNINSLLS